MIQLDKQLKGSRREAIALEWLTNSFYFPLANIILEFFVEGVLGYLVEVDLYAILFASMVQAWFLGCRSFEGRPLPLAGNLIAPAIYSLIEVGFTGLAFFDSPYHLAFWIFSLLIGAIQQWRLTKPDSSALIILEHLVRTNILLVTYWMLEVHLNLGNMSLTVFFTDKTHIFLTVLIFLLGLLIGAANANSNRYLLTLRATAGQLRKYSEWLLGKEILSRAVENPEHLALTRRERGMLFLDIRGFTSWSEQRSPEQVVGMLNECFGIAEQVWSRRPFIKSKFTGDEVMLVMPDAANALETAIELRDEIGLYLDRYHLSCGIGLHFGFLVEGLLGSSDVKAYDVIGDTVNTAKRICDRAVGGEILMSQAFMDQLAVCSAGKARAIDVKGKQQPLIVYPYEVGDVDP